MHFRIKQYILGSSDTFWDQMMHFRIKRCILGSDRAFFGTIIVGTLLFQIMGLYTRGLFQTDNRAAAESRMGDDKAGLDL